ncbi:hypothetical protein PFISCL1PPCAC_3181, partial [Pristionchus fissidentatus]
LVLVLLLLQLLHRHSCRSSTATVVLLHARGARVHLRDGRRRHAHVVQRAEVLLAAVGRVAGGTVGAVVRLRGRLRERAALIRHVVLHGHVGRSAGATAKMEGCHLGRGRGAVGRVAGAAKAAGRGCIRSCCCSNRVVAAGWLRQTRRVQHERLRKLLRLLAGRERVREHVERGHVVAPERILACHHSSPVSDGVEHVVLVRLHGQRVVEVARLAPRVHLARPIRTVRLSVGSAVPPLGAAGRGAASVRVVAAVHRLLLLLLTVVLHHY